MNNTQLRIVSALVLISLVSVCFYFGTFPSLVLVLVAGLISIDEIYCNFMRRKRFSPFYLLSMMVLGIPYAYSNFLNISLESHYIFSGVAILINALLLIYLFKVPMESKLLLKVLEKIPFGAGIILLLPLMSFSTLFHTEKWLAWVIIIMIVNFGMDSGAWFFGKSFGRNKLWPTVSPNKTVEGLLGGMFVSSVLGGGVYSFFFQDISYLVFLIFFVLAGISQLGDLIQSKIKRQYDIKDSSSLIPGHGGVYDRIDSLLFLAPFFVYSLKLANKL